MSSPPGTTSPTDSQQRGEKRPRPSNISLGSFLQGGLQLAGSQGSISQDDLGRQLMTKHKKLDGSVLNKPSFAELSDVDKFQNLDSRINSLRRDVNLNSFRVYGVQKIPDRKFTEDELAAGNKPRKMYLTEILKDIFVKALGLEEELARTLTSSALNDIYRFREGGASRLYCLIFKINRSDLCGHIFKNLPKLANYDNPYGARPLTISKNLSELENRERQRCLAVKDLLKSRGFDIKIRKNVFLSINNGEAKHYTMFLEGMEDQVSKKSRTEDANYQSPLTPTTSGSLPPQQQDKVSRDPRLRSVLSSAYPPLPQAQRAVTPHAVKSQMKDILTTVEQQQQSSQSRSSGSQ